MPPFDRQVAFSGTRDVPPQLRIDEMRLQTYLAACVPGFSGPIEVRQPTAACERAARKAAMVRPLAMRASAFARQAGAT